MSARRHTPPPLETQDLNPPLDIRLLPGSVAKDWLAHVICAVKTIAAGAEFIPLPYIRAAFGTVVDGGYWTREADTTSDRISWQIQGILGHQPQCCEYSVSALQKTATPPQEFRRIAVGDINLLYETAMSSEVYKVKAFTPRVSGEPSLMTVAKYEDENEASLRIPRTAQGKPDTQMYGNYSAFQPPLAYTL
ncbi:hypothetical protein B0H14DRAFT_2615691 [Mycena olivaceomarginata]|nr:hypothetical protein B0H14DRAFT_2615691 [Mycena olivaceomarginata]